MTRETKREFNWEYVFGTLLALFVLAMIVCVGAFLVAPKNVDYYYASHGSDKQNSVTCVYAHWTWHPDETAFCSDDYSRAVDFMTRANATLRAK